MASKASLVPQLGTGQPRLSLRARLDASGLIVVPVIFDAMSARVAFEAGFDTIDIGSLALSASKYALPDTGFINLNDMAEHVRNVRAAVPESIIIADGEAGFGNAAQVVRAVNVLEAAGANAVHIEDQLFGKHVTNRPWLETAKVTADKIAAAVDARTSDEFVVIGRTDTQWAQPRDPDKAFPADEYIERSNLFVEAGADMILLPATSFDKMAEVSSAVRAPVIAPAIQVPPETTWEEVEATGLKVLLYHDLGINSAITNMRRVMQHLAAHRSLGGVSEHLMTGAAIDELMGSNELRDIAVKFNVFPD